MGKGEFGFVHGAPESPETKWEKKLPDGLSVIYTITRVGGGVFIYDCERKRGDTSVKISAQNSGTQLTPEQVEKLPRFVEFVATGKI
jgi:hypothetical protein